MTNYRIGPHRTDVRCDPMWSDAVISHTPKREQGIDRDRRMNPIYSCEPHNSSAICSYLAATLIDTFLHEEYRKLQAVDYL